MENAAIKMKSAVMPAQAGIPLSCQRRSGIAAFAGVTARVMAFSLALMISACTAPHLPFEKPTPVAAPDQSLIAPPWEALVQAGPDAEKDIDLETLNGPTAAPQPEMASATGASTPQPPATAAKPGATAINAVAVLPVVGAPELSAAMAQVLSDAGWPVLKAARKDALSIQGRVILDEPQGAQQAVHLHWEVKTPQGKLLGDVAQNNQIPAGSLAKGWGQNAMLAAQGGADGVVKLIQQYR